jgi:hypothetical protein
MEDQEHPIILKTISGGQTGVDRAAFDAGMELCILIGGCCPKGRRSEDGKTPCKYPLTETSTANYGIRAEKNIIKSEGTLILAGEITVQTCWDADWLDLGRVGIMPDPRYLCTIAAKQPEFLNWAYERSRLLYEPEICGQWGIP